MPIEQALATTEVLTPHLSLAAHRAGKALAKLSEFELLTLLGIELQRRGLQELGTLPKPRARPAKRSKVEREQFLLFLPVHDDMCDR
jgi:hypothetical protein